MFEEEPKARCPDCQQSLTFVPTDSGDIKSLLLSVDKEQFKTLLDDRDLSREFEVSHDKIATVGDVVILADVFSPSALAPARPSDPIQGARWCSKSARETDRIKTPSQLRTDCPTGKLDRIQICIVEFDSYSCTKPA